MEFLNDFEEEELSKKMGINKGCKNRVSKKAYQLARTFVLPMDHSVEYQRRCHIYKNVLGMACAYGYHALVKVMVEEAPMEIDINEPCPKIKFQNHSGAFFFRPTWMTTYIMHTISHMLHGEYKSLENHKNVVSYLLEKGATLDCVLNGVHLLQLALNISPTFFHSLVSSGVDFQLPPDMMKTAIHIGDVESVYAVLNIGVTPTIRDLYEAYRFRDPEIARIFLSRHISPNERDTLEESLLFLALLDKDEEFVELFVEYGANVEQALNDLHHTIQHRNMDVASEYKCILSFLDDLTKHTLKN